METGTVVNGWLAFVGVLAGGAVTKVIDRYFAVHERKIRSEDERRKELQTEETGFRAELRTQIIELRKELQETRLHVGDLQTMVDEWRDKYYQNVAENLDLNRRYADLQREHDVLSKSHEVLTGQFSELARKVREAGVEI